jgi:hypothetical protein
MSYYAIKTVARDLKSYMLGKFNDKSSALEFLYDKLTEYSEDHQVILEKDEVNNKVSVYKRNHGIFLSSKELIECYCIIKHPESEFAKAVLKSIKKDKQKNI